MVKKVLHFLRKDQVSCLDVKKMKVIENSIRDTTYVHLSELSTLLAIFTNFRDLLDDENELSRIENNSKSSFDSLVGELLRVYKKDSRIITRIEFYKAVLIVSHCFCSFPDFYSEERMKDLLPILQELYKLELTLDS